MISLKKSSLLLGSIFLGFPLIGRNVLLEFKGAYFLPTGNTFKHIYNGNALYGPELTVQLSKCHNWYAFGSIDYLKVKGHSLGLESPTTAQLLPLACGLKYFVPTGACFDFYLGLGFEAVNVQTKDYLTAVASKKSKWGFGGIAKFGGYWYVSRHFLIDLFIDYSFVKAGNNGAVNQITGLQSVKADVSGVILGGGIGYRF